MLLGVSALLGVAAMLMIAKISDARDTQQARSLVEELGTDDLSKVKGTLTALAPYRAKAEPMLLDARLRANSDADRRKYSLALARLGIDASPDQISGLNEWLLNTDAASFAMLRDLLQPFADQLSATDWNTLEQPGSVALLRFKAACGAERSSFRRTTRLAFSAGSNRRRWSPKLWWLRLAGRTRLD